jgi:hypothetical protein
LKEDEDSENFEEIQDFKEKKGKEKNGGKRKKICKCATEYSRKTKYRRKG